MCHTTCIHVVLQTLWHVNVGIYYFQCGVPLTDVMVPMLFVQDRASLPLYYTGIHGEEIGETRGFQCVYLFFFDVVEIELERVEGLDQALHVSWGSAVTEPLYIILLHHIIILYANTHTPCVWVDS